MVDFQHKRSNDFAPWIDLSMKIVKQGSFNYIIIRGFGIRSVCKQFKLLAYKSYPELEYEEHHFEEDTRHEFYKAIIGYRIGELFVEVAADTILIILLKIAIGAEMIAYKKCLHLIFRKSPFTISVTFPIAIMGG